MCGIAGIVKLRAGTADRDQLKDMIEMVQHRGPDSQGIFISDETGLAHVRLSILDLEGGQQPMTTPDGRMTITFNGEIFNYIELRDELLRQGHKFATRSDTEVILHLYQEEGENCVRHLNGQWAFAIWDATEHKLFLSRDRLGVRPLFYTQTGNSFLFASEIKALLAHPDVFRELDLEAIDQIFTFWVTLPPRTAFKNVRQLPPGHSLTLQNGHFHIKQDWVLEYTPDNGSIERQKQLSEELLALLTDATRLRLRSDVPVGAYLSGGLDSTLITALTKSLVGHKLRTFSIAFEDNEFDESPYQREAYAFLHTEHNTVRCSYSDIANVFPEVIWHAEQPILRTAPAPLYLLAKLVREEGFKVVLTGEGADEVLGGYDIFQETKIRLFCSRNSDSRWRPLLLKRLYPYMAGIQRQPVEYLRQFFHVTRDDVASPFFSHLPRWRLTSKLKMFFSESVRNVIPQHGAFTELEKQLPSSFTSWPAFNRAEHMETQYLLPGYILSSQGDRMAMAHAVEGRYPFLDHRVVEFAAKLPSSLKMHVLDQKHLLKCAARGLIPDSIRRRHKQPYRAPDGKSFFRSTPDYVQDLLSPDTLRRDGLFDPVRVAALVAKFKNGSITSVRDDMALIGILSTQLLIHQFICHVKPRPLPMELAVH